MKTVIDLLALARAIAAAEGQYHEDTQCSIVWDAYAQRWDIDVDGLGDCDRDLATAIDLTYRVLVDHARRVLRHPSYEAREGSVEALERMVQP